MNKPIDVTDRRAHPRIPAEVELRGTPEKGGTVARMITSNLSMGGLHCVSTASFPEMTRLAVRMMLPAQPSGAHDKPVDVEAVVVRQEELPSSTTNQPRYELALFFTNLKNGARDDLARYLDH